MTSSNTYLPVKYIALWLGLLILTAILVNYLHFSDSSYSGLVNLDAIPKVIGPWRGVDKFFRNDIYPQLGADETVLRLYQNTETTKKLWLYVSYTRNLREYNMGPHSPEVCYPAQGWKIIHESVEPVVLNNGYSPIIQINEMIVEQGTQRRLVYYWFQSRDQIILSTFRQNYYAFWDKLLHNRSDVAFVRVSLLVNRQEATEAEDAKDFIQGLFPYLLQAIPQ